MEYSSVIFYLALIVILGCIAEIYVRLKGVGENVEKIRGVVVPNKPRLGPPIALLIAAIVVLIITFPR